MAQRYFWVKANPQAAATLEKIVDAMNKAGCGSYGAQLTLDTPFKTSHLAFHTSFDNYKKRDEYVKFKELLAANPFLSINSIRLAIDNGGNLRYDVEEPSRTIAKFDFDLSGTIASDASLLNILRAFHEEFELFNPNQLAAVQLEKTQRDSLKYYELSLQDLNKAVAHLGEHTALQTTKLSEFLLARTNELEARYTERQATLDKLAEERSAALDAERAKFREEVKEHDARNRTIVRRDIFQHIRKIIEQRKTPELQDTTIEKRDPVKKLLAWLAIISGGAAIAFITKVLFATSADWHLFLPLSASSLTFVSTMIYYIRWNDTWFRDHANAEFSNRKFEADMLRASWIAEMFFEWKEEKPTEFPPQLMNSLVQNLFVEPNTQPRDLHPVEQALKALTTANKVKINNAGIELEKQKPESA